MSDRFELHLFAEVGDLVRSMAPDGIGDVRIHARRWGIKVWTGPSKPTREHYEGQFIPRRHLVDTGDSDASGRDGMALEIGFHAEHKDEAENQAVLDRLNASSKLWRKELGKPAEAGVFLGRDSWRRISEVWLDAEMDDPELAMEVASRLVDYLSVLEPIRLDK